MDKIPQSLLDDLKRSIDLTRPPERYREIREAAQEIFNIVLLVVNFLNRHTADIEHKLDRAFPHGMGVYSHVGGESWEFLTVQSNGGVWDGRKKPGFLPFISRTFAAFNEALDNWDDLEARRITEGSVDLLARTWTLCNALAFESEASAFRADATHVWNPLYWQRIAPFPTPSSEA